MKVLMNDLSFPLIKCLQKMVYNFQGKYKLIYYDGFDKVVSRKGILKKMNADEISKLVNFIIE